MDWVVRNGAVGACKEIVAGVVGCNRTWVVDGACVPGKEVHSLAYVADTFEIASVVVAVVVDNTQSR